MSTDETLIYPVGWLDAWKTRQMRWQWRYTVEKLQARPRQWRDLRNSFNGYLCEHTGHPHNAGRGWTKRAAARRAERLCRKAR